MAILTDKATKLGVEIKVTKISGPYTQYQLGFLNDGKVQNMHQNLQEFSVMEDYEKPSLILFFEKMAEEEDKKFDYWTAIEYSQTIAIYANQKLPFENCTCPDDDDDFYQDSFSLIITDCPQKGHEAPYGNALILKVDRAEIKAFAKSLRAEWQRIS